MINVIIPVHNRINSTLECISSLKKQDCVNDLKLFVINDGSTDDTNNIINKNYPDINIYNGSGSLFWGGAVNFGISKVLQICSKDDWILLVNNDVVLKSDAISKLVEESNKYNRKCISGALSVSNQDKETVIKSGSIVKSWFLNITSHKFINKNIKNIKNLIPVEVDFLTGRCLLHPVELFKLAGNYDSKNFLHYGADDEFSMRIKKFGYSSILCPSSIVYLKENQPIKFKKKSYYKKLLFYLFDIKSSANIINKFNLTLKVVPLYAKVTFFFVGVLKSLIIFLKKNA